MNDNENNMTALEEQLTTVKKWQAKLKTDGGGKYEEDSLQSMQRLIDNYEKQIKELKGNRG